MPRVSWNAVGSRIYETGVDRGVLYLDSQPGIPWNGLTAVVESSAGGDAKPFYLDGVKYLNVPAAEDFEATLTAFTYPVEFSACDGTGRARPGMFLGQQRRKSFGLCYRTLVGNDLEGADYGYKLHLIYNALAAPSDRNYATGGKDAEISDFSWKITTTPLLIAGYKPTAHIILDSRYIDSITLGRIEDMVYGSDSNAAYLPTFDQITAELDDPTTFLLTDFGDGHYEIDAPLTVMTYDPIAGLFELTWPTANDNGDGTFTISS